MHSGQASTCIIKERLPIFFTQPRKMYEMGGVISCNCIFNHMEHLSALAPAKNSFLLPFFLFLGLDVRCRREVVLDDRLRVL
jgi:hypothetical protein